MKKAMLLLLIAVLICTGTAGAYSLRLPANLEVVRTEAFKGDVALDKLILPPGLKAIESKAFSGAGIRSLYAGDISGIDIAADAFDGRTLFLFPMTDGALTIAQGTRGQIVFSQYPKPATLPAVTYSSADPSIASVSAEGVVSGHLMGSTEITITDANGVSAGLTVNVVSYASMHDYIVVGHRGASGYRQDNSLDAFRYAATLGADMVELDVRRTSDGQLVCYHDASLDGKDISSLTLKRIRQLDSRVCSLEEALTCIVQTNMEVMIELKISGLESDTVALVEKTGMTDRCCYGSFIPMVLYYVRELDPDAETVYILNNINSINNLIANPSAYNCDAASLSKTYLTYATIAKLHLAGLKVYGWTINEYSDIKTFLDKGIDGIITDYPDRA